MKKEPALAEIDRDRKASWGERAVDKPEYRCPAKNYWDSEREAEPSKG